jgi:hypothetical protein
MTVAAVLRALPPVTLDELVRRAALLVRMERKYLLDPADLASVLARLSVDVQVLEIDGRREFGYHSLYLDTPNLECYLATTYGRRHRFKVRVRGYLESGLRFLEVKTRGRRGETVKHRVPYFGEGPALTHLLAAAGVATDPRHLEAALNVSYRRTTLFLPSSNARISIDSGLTWALPGGAGVRLADLTVVETKSAGVTPADRMLWSLGHRPCSVSKYCVGLATVRPDLPANRWRSVLRRHFRTVAEAATPR